MNNLGSKNRSVVLHFYGMFDEFSSVDFCVNLSLWLPYLIKCIDVPLKHIQGFSYFCWFLAKFHSKARFMPLHNTLLLRQNHFSNAWPGIFCPFCTVRYSVQSSTLFMSQIYSFLCARKMPSIIFKLDNIIRYFIVSMMQILGPQGDGIFWPPSTRWVGRCRPQ